MAALSDMAWFSSMDRTAGLDQIKMNSAKLKTAFICDSGLYEYKCAFQRLMDSVFASPLVRPEVTPLKSISGNEVALA